MPTRLAVPGTRDRQRDIGVSLIVAYKAAKATLELVLLAGLLLAAGAEAGWLRSLADAVRTHLASRWCIAASEALGALASPRGIRIAEAGLALDGLLTAVEGGSLWMGYRWGEWLVVWATLIPLPWEIWEIARTGSGVRVAVAAANLAVAGYLAGRIVRQRRP